jgi:CheY-like chemotaxis protein
MTRLGLTILLVEDDDEVRESLELILRAEGYDVRSAATAEDGLRHLQERRPHLVVTDFALPERTGGWMIEEARRLNLLHDTATLVVTAFQELPRLDAPVFRKPLDLDHFLRKVDELLQPARNRTLELMQRQLHESFSERRDSGVRVELVLYISASSPSSLKALRNLQNILAGFDPSQVSFVVCDLSLGYPDGAAQDRVAFTPTLVKRLPTPKVWILGHLDNTQLVEDLLHDAGVDRIGKTSVPD